MPQIYELNRHLRYETIGKDSNSAKHSEKRKAEIEGRERNAESIKAIQNQKAMNERADWLENFHVKRDETAANAANKALQGEYSAAVNLKLQVRRMALRDLLAAEHEAYSRELNSHGLTFQQFRI